jgi:hypothetical protein
MFATAILCGAVVMPCAQAAIAAETGLRDSLHVSPLEITTRVPSMAVGRPNEPALARPEYVLPPVDVHAFRTLSAPDFPILAWTDTDLRGVHRYEADATSLRLALNLVWLNPFNW